MTHGFEIAVHQCEMCGETAEGIPDTFEALGLPEGWIAVRLMRYKERSAGPTMAFDHLRVLYYCSEAHLPSELLPDV